MKANAVVLRFSGTVGALVSTLLLSSGECLEMTMMLSSEGDDSNRTEDQESGRQQLKNQDYVAVMAEMACTG